MPFVTDLLHFAKCLRNKLSHHPLSLNSSLRPITGEAVAASLGFGTCLDPKSPGSQLKDSLALRVFTLENLAKLVGSNSTIAAIYFLPVVLWRLANQAVNITRDGRLHLLDIAFQAARRCNSALQLCKLPKTGGKNEKLFLYRQVDLQRLLSSLVVIGVILTLPMPRINLARIGTSGLEHLFGVTRLGTRGNNGAIRIQRQMARATLVKWIGEENGLQIGKARKRNLAGTIDDLTREGLIPIPLLDTFEGISVVVSFIQNVLAGPTAGFPSFEYPGRLILGNWLSFLMRDVKDGQNNTDHETRLAGVNIFRRITALGPVKTELPAEHSELTIDEIDLAGL
jgi:hypothetical protein